MKYSRYHAFCFHLLLSLGVATLSAMLVFYVWYIRPLNIAAGVTEIYFLMLCVDVVIGPFITLVVFDTRKKELKRDLFIVLLLQMAALFYGLFVVFVARPVYLCYNIDRFDLVFANDVDSENLKKVTDTRFRSLPLLQPQFVAAVRPNSTKERNDLMFSALNGSSDLPQMPQYYVPYIEQKEQIKQHIRSLLELRSFNLNKIKELDLVLKKYSNSSGGVGFIPLKGKVSDLVVIVRMDTAEVIEILDLQPWK